MRGGVTIIPNAAARTAPWSASRAGASFISNTRACRTSASRARQAGGGLGNPTGRPLEPR